jgi:alpha-amylase/alpha-mannosidase (GH57 family)
MFWANLLHFYQPYRQKRDIIDAITEQCYRPVAQGLLDNPGGKLTINFTGVLLDQLAEYGHSDVIEMYAEAARRGQVEFVGSAKYHTTLPLLEPSEALRQIQINDEANRRHLGDAYRRRGIFLPEMAYDPKLAPLLEQAGFDWVMLDELAHSGKIGTVDYSKQYLIEGTNLRAVFREHRLSATIMSAGPRDTAALKEAAGPALHEHRAIITGMDGETFGHHRVGHEQLLFGMFRDPEINLVRVSDVLEEFTDTETVPTVACTWASSEYDIEHGIQFVSWNDPENPIHQLQWELMNLVTATVHAADKTAPGYDVARRKLDPALASDQFFWATAKPWWMIEHIEGGAHYLLDTLQNVPNVPAETVERGLKLYQHILAMSYDWQRTGKVNDVTSSGKDAKIRIPLRENTFEKGGELSAVWDAYVHILRTEEQAAAARGDYEAAILWRDGLYKLEHKLDIYDAWYVTDLLRFKLLNGRVEEVIAEYKARYDHIRGGQVEQRSN